MMKVTVEMRTMEREKRARNWASLLVQGYSIVFHNQDLHLPSIRELKTYLVNKWITCPSQCYQSLPQQPAPGSSSFVWDLRPSHSAEHQPDDWLMNHWNNFKISSPRDNTSKHSMAPWSTHQCPNRECPFEVLSTIFDINHLLVENRISKW